MRLHKEDVEAIESVEIKFSIDAKDGEVFLS